MNHNYRLIFKWLLYLLVYAVWVVLQTNVLPFLTLFGARPNMLPVAAAMVAVLEGGVPGALFGVFAGLCCEAVMPFHVIYLIWFFLSGLLIGNLVAALFKKTFVTAALCGLASLTVLDFFAMLFFFLIPRRAGLSALTPVALSEIACSALLTPFVYWPLKAVSRMGEKELEGEQ